MRATAFFQDFARCLFVWKAQQATMEQIARADAIVTMAQGLLKNGDPSPGDHLFANVLRDLHLWFPEKPMIPQEPVAMAADELRYAAVARPPKGNALGSSNLKWNSRSVARFQANACRDIFPEKKGVIVALIAAPPTQPRAKWELERCGLKVLVVPMPAYRKKLYGHPDSIYWYCRGGNARYLMMEGTRGRAHYLFYYFGVE